MGSHIPHWIDGKSVITPAARKVGTGRWLDPSHGGINLAFLKNV